MAAAVLASATIAQASTIDWSKTAASTDWSAGGNWVNGTAPANDLTTDIARFNQTSYGPQPLVGTASISGVIIGTSSAAVTLSGTQLNIGSNGINMTSGAANSSITAGVVAATSQTWTNASSTSNRLLTFSGSVAIASGAALQINATSGAMTLSGPLNDHTDVTGGNPAGSISISGAKSVTLSSTGTNTFSGNIAVSNGSLVFGGANDMNYSGAKVQLGTGGTLSLSSTAGSKTVTLNKLSDGVGGGGTVTATTAGILSLTGNDDYSFSGTITNASGRALTLNKAGAGTFTINNGNNSYTGTTKIAGGTLSIDTLTNESAMTYVRPFSADQDKLTFTGSTGYTDIVNAGYGVGSVITGSGIADGTTIVAISAADSSVTLSTKTIAAVGSNSAVNVGITNNSSIGVSATTGANLIIDGGTLRYTGAATSTNRNFQIGTTVDGATGTLDASGTGAVAFTNISKIVYGNNNQARNLVLTGTNTSDNSLANIIANNGTGVATVTKNGTGTWVLTGANLYTGNTTINSGLLKVANTTGSATGTGAVTVGDGIGTARLGGTGIISGAVTVNNHSAIDTGDGTIGALTLGGGLTLNTGSSLVIDLGAAGADHTSPGIADLLTLTGAAKVLNLSSGMNLVLNSGSENLVDTGSYKLLAYAGTVQIDGAAQSSTLDITNLFTLTGFDGVQTTVTLDTANKAIWLDYTATAPVPEPAAFTLLATGIGGLMLIRRKRR